MLTCARRPSQGWTQFVKMAMDSKGEFVLLQGPSFKEGPVAIVFNFKGQVCRMLAEAGAVTLPAYGGGCACGAGVPVRKAELVPVHVHAC